ncbi:MAG: Uma2 family endonuclease, partial [Anaerolineae bacterium]|nr:Uma2 family endonuclease [Anaerolineae bacterium]
LPENAERTFELLNGEIIEKMPGTTRNSAIAVNIAFEVRLFCREKSLPCYLSTGDGAYQIAANVIAPDLAYKSTPMSDEYPDPTPPLWVVEVISPTDKAAEIRRKRQIYQAAGILLWEVYPELMSVDVYAPGQASRVFQADDVLSLDALLPGFTLPVRSVFAE